MGRRWSIGSSDGGGQQIVVKFSLSSPTSQTIKCQPSPWASSQSAAASRVASGFLLPPRPLSCTVTRPAARGTPARRIMTTKGEQFAGLTVALITPFKNGEVDYERLTRLVDWHVEQGTDC